MRRGRRKEEGGERWEEGGEKRREERGGKREEGEEANPNLTRSPLSGVWAKRMRESIEGRIAEAVELGGVGVASIAPSAA